MQSTLLSINNYYYRRGGAEVVFLEQNRLFEEIGWQVVPFSMRHPGNLVSPWEDGFIEEIEFGKKYPFSRKVINASRVVYSLEARSKVERLVDRVKPTIAHAHNVYHHISPAIFGKLKSLGVPTVLSLHDLKIVCPAYTMLSQDGLCERCKGGRIWNVVAQECIKQSRLLSLLILIETAVQRLLGCYSTHVDRFVVPSRFYIDKFVEWGWPRERFCHVPNFVDTRQLEPSGSPGEAFVYVGRLSREKGLATFVRALSLSGAKGRIIGTGPQEEELRQLAAQTGAAVEFLGYHKGTELLDEMRNARALVIPSEWYENAPMSVLEAYALSRPVIGAEIGGIPELIREGQTGTLFASGDPEALAAKLDEFASKPTGDIAAMGRLGRQWLEVDFAAESYRERLMHLYRSMGVAC